MHRYKVFNAAMATTAAPVKVTTTTAIKTMLQLATPATRMIQILSWGYELDAVPGTAGLVELIQTDVAASGLTAHVASGVQPLFPGIPASQLTLGAGATGYAPAGAVTEGATAATRSFDTNLVPATAGAASISYDYQFMPDERPVVSASAFLRVRATFGGAVNMLTWVCFDE